MPSRPLRLWICTWILALLAQLAWSTTMPVLGDGLTTMPTAHGTHSAHETEAASSSHHPLHACDPAPSQGSDHGPTNGHACCPLLGLAPATGVPMVMGPRHAYGPAATPTPPGDVVSVIFKPPKTRV